MEKIILTKEELIKAYTDRNGTTSRSVLENHKTINDAVKSQEYFELLTTKEANEVFKGMFKIQTKLKKEFPETYKELIEIEKHNRVAKVLKN